MVLALTLLLAADTAQARPRVRRTRQAAAAARVDLDFARADIHNVLRFLARVGGINVVIADEVRGTVSLRLRRVHWKTALQVILRSKGLDSEWIGRGVLWVASAATLAKERAQRIRRRRDCLATAPLVTRIVRLSYARAEKVAPKVRAALRSRRGRVMVDERTNALIISDVQGCR